MGSNSKPLPKPWVQTPCVRSAALSRAAGCEIFLKLENLQPSGSFKSRGVGNLMLRASEAHETKPIHFYCSSGGNAGLACATAAISLGRAATIVVPHSTTPLMIGKLKTLGADVHQHGANWYQADSYLREELLANDPNGVYVPPFDHPDIWQGASTLIDEIDKQIGEFDGIVCSVGGGGLFLGIVEGLDKKRYKNDVKILAVETEGADSLAQCIQKGEHITLPGITSIATSLGCIKVATKAYQEAQRKEVTCLVLSDAEAAMGSVRFADDERILVEAACGVSIAPVYNGQLRKTLGKGLSDEEWKQQRIVITVCGGSNVTVAMLEAYKEKYGKAFEQHAQSALGKQTVLDPVTKQPQVPNINHDLETHRKLGE